MKSRSRPKPRSPSADILRRKDLICPCKRRWVASGEKAGRMRADAEVFRRRLARSRLLVRRSLPVAGGSSVLTCRQPIRAQGGPLPWHVACLHPELRIRFRLTVAVSSRSSWVVRSRFRQPRSLAAPASKGELGGLPRTGGAAIAAAMVGAGAVVVQDARAHKCGSHSPARAACAQAAPRAPAGRKSQLGNRRVSQRR
jgi:hypothetical protein